MSTRITTLDLNPLYRNSIGLDRVLDRFLNNSVSAGASNYPPYNILKTGDNTFQVQVAIAGFDEGEVEITVKEGNLIITGEKIPVEESSDSEVVYFHQGIGSRRFIRTFSLDEYVEVTGASSKNGILTVSLERIIPESIKPKSIAITYQN
jgi:molecular chaperone IbpA